MKVGIGIATFNRPIAFGQCLESVLENAPDSAYLYVSDDGSDLDYGDSFSALEPLGVKRFRGEHSNIATSKNRLLQAMMDDGVDHLFVIEDDIRVLHPDAFVRPIEGCERYGMNHTMFAHHGSRNSMVEEGSFFSYHYECVGAFCYYSRKAIFEVGLMDTHFHNAFEHVVHTMLIGDAGLMPGARWRRFPDVVGSTMTLEELDVPSSHLVTSEEDHMKKEHVQSALRYWKEHYRFPSDVEPLLLKES